MRNITEILVHTGEEPFNVESDILHETLLNLPAHVYLDVFHMMKNRIDGNYNIYSGILKKQLESCSCEIRSDIPKDLEDNPCTPTP